MRAFIILVLLLFVAPAHAGKYKAITCKGKVHIGSTDSAIEGLNGSYIWVTNSPVGAKIVEECNITDDCEIAGLVDGNDVVVRLSSARRVDSAVEPPIELVKNGACLASPVGGKCDETSCLSVNITNMHVRRVVSDGTVSLSYRVNMICDSISSKIVVYKGVSFRLARKGGVWVYEK